MKKCNYWFVVDVNNIPLETETVYGDQVNTIFSTRKEARQQKKEIVNECPNEICKVKRGKIVIYGT